MARIIALSHFLPFVKFNGLAGSFSVHDTMYGSSTVPSPAKSYMRTSFVTSPPAGSALLSCSSVRGSLGFR